jgi:hypothetical protein
MPTGEFTSESSASKMKADKDSTTGGVTRQTRIAGRKCRSPRKRQRDQHQPPDGVAAQGQEKKRHR